MSKLAMVGLTAASPLAEGRELKYPPFLRSSRPAPSPLAEGRELKSAYKALTTYAPSRPSRRGVN